MPTVWHRFADAIPELEPDSLGARISVLDDLDLADEKDVVRVISRILLMDSAPVYYVISIGSLEAPRIKALFANLIRQPNCRVINTKLPTESNVRSLVDESGLSVDSTGVASILWMCGANRYLLRALLEDSSATGHIVPGMHYRHTALNAIRRCGKVGVDVARALAVLGEFGTKSTVADLLEMSLTDVEEAFRLLT